MGMCDAAVIPGEVRLLLLQYMWWEDVGMSHTFRKSVF